MKQFCLMGIQWNKRWLRLMTILIIISGLISPHITMADEQTTVTNGEVETASPESGSKPPIPDGDPFAMRGGVADSDGFLNVGPVAIPPGIRVVGILALADKAPVGALSIPGSKNLHFVHEGDVIYVDQSISGKVNTASDSQLYLLVKSITHSQIEIAPRTRPQDVRIYR